MKNCKQVQTEWMERMGQTNPAEGLASSSSIQVHIDGCQSCRKEMSEMRSLMQAMDAWQAPTPNPYFMTRFEARLAEERAARPEGWFARIQRHLHARVVYGLRWRFQPVAATALSVLVLAGGGAYLGFMLPEPQPAPAVITVSPAVLQDLQNMETNASALDTLENLSTNSD
jgi:hypothetical protein